MTSPASQQGDALRASAPVWVIATTVAANTLAIAAFRDLNGGYKADDAQWMLWCAFTALISGFLAGWSRASNLPWLYYPIWGLILASISGLAGAIYLLSSGAVGSVDKLIALSGTNGSLFMLLIPMAFTLAAAMGHAAAPPNHYQSGHYQSGHYPPSTYQSAPYQTGQPPSGLPSPQSGTAPFFSSGQPMAPSQTVMAQVVLSVGDVARSRAFYLPLLTGLGMAVRADTPLGFECGGSGGSISLKPADPMRALEPFDGGRPGLNRITLRAPSREDVDRLHEVVRQSQGRVIQEPGPRAWPQGAYGLVVQDPDGILIEIVHLPYGASL